MSDEGRVTKTSDTVPIQEVEPLFNLLENKAHINRMQAMSMIGYKSPSATLTEMTRVGRVKRVIKMALVGLVAQKNIEDRPKSQLLQINFDQAELLFDILRKSREQFPGRSTAINELISAVATHMAQLVK